MGDEDRASLVIFGRDLMKIPCLRTSFLYSISSYIGVGLATFLITSRPALSSHVGFTAFVVVTFGYYMNCRANIARTKLEIAQLQEALRRAAILEGTESDPKKVKLEDV